VAVPDGFDPPDPDWLDPPDPDGFDPGDPEWPDAGDPAWPPKALDRAGREPDPLVDWCPWPADPVGALAPGDPAELAACSPDGELTARAITTAWRTRAPASVRPSNVRARVESRRPDGDGSGGDAVSGSERSVVSKVSLIALFAA